MLEKCDILFPLPQVMVKQKFVAKPKDEMCMGILFIDNCPVISYNAVHSEEGGLQHAV